jgi:hypothetical protein
VGAPAIVIEVVLVVVVVVLVLVVVLIQVLSVVVVSVSPLHSLVPQQELALDNNPSLPTQSPP